MVFTESYFEFYCSICDKQYTNYHHKWCNPCQINHLMANFASWTSENEKIDNFIQEMQLKIDDYDDMFEWIPYDKFDTIKEITNYDFAVIYSALWKNGPLEYKENTKKYTRDQNKTIFFKCLYNIQNVDEFIINEV
jgi:hypothetical protein